MTVPAVTAVSPAAGPIAGATSVTITGTGFTAATAVKFGATNAASFNVNSDTSITAVSPTAGAGTVDVTVTTAGGTSATSAADQFRYAGVPSVTGVSPANGPGIGGSFVTITGTALTGATAVNFGANASPSFAVVNSTTIIAEAPAGTGIVDVTVTTPGGTSPTSAADQFTYALATVMVFPPASDTRAIETMWIERALEIAAHNIRSQGGAATSGNILADGAQQIGSWSYSPIAAK